MLTDLTNDSVSFYLLVATALLVGVPGVLLVAWRASRPPSRLPSFRWLYLAWACLLGSASVWTLERVPRFSAAEAGADNYLRLAFLGLGFLVILVVAALYRFAFFSELVTGALGIFFFFALWGLASVAWSVSPAGTFYKAFEYFAMILLFALVASLINLAVRNPRDRLLAVKSVFDFNWFLILAMIASIYVGLLLLPERALVVPEAGETGPLPFALSGVLPGLANNAVGQLGAVMGVVAVARLLHKPGSRMLWVPVLAIAVLTMVLGNSRSPILAFFVAVALLLAMNRWFWVLVPSSALLGGAFFWRYGELVYDYMRRGQSDEQLATLTGRVVYWQASLEAWRERPFEGYGANVGGRHVLEDTLSRAASTAHSVWVEVLLDTGVVGATLVAAGLIATWFMLFNLRSRSMVDPISRMLWFECLGVMAVLSVRSVFSITLAWTPHVLTLGVILVFLAVMRRQAIRAHPADAPLARRPAALPAGQRR